jgi:hypothetical protein
MKTTFQIMTTLAVVTASALASTPADACGGCFIAPPPAPTPGVSAPSDNTTVVTGHRMVLAVSSVQTVLWDQIVYSGDPDEFAWVLPVKPGAYLELASDSWFETLEAATRVQVNPPPVICDGGGSVSFGCSSDSEEGSFVAQRGGAEPVQVLHEGTVGPYQTVTLSTSTPGALNDWLAEHGYGVDPGTQPVIDAYVDEQFDFIALRLLPDAGVRRMRPVRVVTPGASPALPLRMVAAGTGAQVPIVLYVVGEGRWTTANFSSTTVPIDLLSWNFAHDESNYAVLRDRTLDTDAGRGWLTTYARKGTLFSDINPPNGFSPATGQMLPPALLHEVYMAQAVSNGEIDETCSLPNLLDEPRVIVDACPGVPSDDPSCLTTVDGIDARTLECRGLDDLAVALTGMHPRDVWVTRLEANLPREALDSDLILEAADHQQPLSNILTARVAIGAEAVCGSATPVRLDPGDRTRTEVLLVSGGLLAMIAALARRRSRAHACPALTRAVASM